jgi:hypothetical protein
MICVCVRGSGASKPRSAVAEAASRRSSMSAPGMGGGTVWGVSDAAGAPTSGGTVRRASERSGKKHGAVSGAGGEDTQAGQRGCELHGEANAQEQAAG